MRGEGRAVRGEGTQLKHLPAIVVDDDVAELRALTALRPAFDVRGGAFTLLERLERLGVEVAGVVVPGRLEALVRERWPELSVNGDCADFGEALVVNGRAGAAMAGMIERAQGGKAVADIHGELVCARLDRAGVDRVVRERSVGSIAVGGDTRSGELLVLTRPWHVKTMRDRCLAIDLMLLGAKTSVHATAKVSASAVLDDASGPIVIDEQAEVRHGAVVLGPVYVGPHSTVLERAVIRGGGGGTAIGPWCKVAGEVGGVIFQGYSNKAHDGYLGDSYVGEWVNLGAGTTGSNLLNTYGEIIAKALPDPHGRNERTGEQFFGAVIGDHVKTAICTRLMTGCVLHPGSMFASTSAVSGCVGALAWVTDEGVRAYRVEKFLEVMKAAMARRKVVPTEAYVECVRQLNARAAM